MGRPLRAAAGGFVYHVLNRVNGRATLFAKAADYAAFLRVLGEAVARADTRLLAYCVMPNHWHLVVWPRRDGELARFVGWLTLTHTQRWHAHSHTAGTGHLYQGRYKSFPVQADEHLRTVCRYVERNPVRAGLVRRAEAWRWGSLWPRGPEEEEAARPVLAAWPVPRPRGWLAFVNAPQTAAEILTPLAVKSGAPQVWQELARVHNNRAILLYTSARPNDAASAFRQVKAVFQGLVRDFTEEPQYRKELAAACNNLGYLLAETNQLNEAEQDHVTALEIRKKLVNEFRSVPEYHYDLAISHKNLGKVLGLLNRVKEAESASRDAVGILAKLTEKFPRQPQIRHSLAQGQNMLGELLRKTGRPEEAETSFREALKHLQELVKQPPLVPDYQSDLGNTLANLALASRERNEPAEARRLLEQALHHQHAAVTSNRTHPEYRRSLRNHYQDMAEL